MYLTTWSRKFSSGIFQSRFPLAFYHMDTYITLRLTAESGCASHALSCLIISIICSGFSAFLVPVIGAPWGYPKLVVESKSILYLSVALFEVKQTRILTYSGVVHCEPMAPRCNYFHSTLAEVTGSFPKSQSWVGQCLRYSVAVADECKEERRGGRRGELLWIKLLAPRVWNGCFLVFTKIRMTSGVP